MTAFADRPAGSSAGTGSDGDLRHRDAVPGGPAPVGRAVPEPSVGGGSSRRARADRHGPLGRCRRRPRGPGTARPGPAGPGEYRWDVRARVPASSANLGPGFDTLALALDRYVVVDVEPASKLIVRRRGRGRASPTTRPPGRPGGHRRGRHRPPGHHRPLRDPDRPGPRVLGRTGRGRRRGRRCQDPLAVAAADGRPSRQRRRLDGGRLRGRRVVKGGVHVVRLPLDVSLAFVVIVPDVHLSTARARQALPAEVSRESAAFNLGRMALLMAGMADRRLLIPEAAEDRLHQDYRSPLFPAAPKLLSAWWPAARWPPAGRVPGPRSSGSAGGRRPQGPDRRRTGPGRGRPARRGAAVARRHGRPHRRP